MISSGAFNYINILEKTADASWLRHSVISNNIANADTPTYKRKDVTFQSYLEEQLTGGESLDDAVADAELDLLNGSIYTAVEQIKLRVCHCIIQRLSAGQLLLQITLERHILSLIGRCVRISNIVGDNRMPQPACICGLLQYIDIVKCT